MEKNEPKNAKNNPWEHRNESNIHQPHDHTNENVHRRDNIDGSQHFQSYNQETTNYYNGLQGTTPSTNQTKIWKHLAPKHVL